MLEWLWLVGKSRPSSMQSCCHRPENCGETRSKKGIEMTRVCQEQLYDFADSSSGGSLRSSTPTTLPAPRSASQLRSQNQPTASPRFVQTPVQCTKKASLCCRSSHPRDKSLFPPITDRGRRRGRCSADKQHPQKPLTSPRVCGGGVVPS